MTQKYQLSAEEFDTAVAMLTRGPITAQDLCAALEIRDERARHVLGVVAVATTTAHRFAGRPATVYTLHPDYVARIACRRIAQGFRLDRIARRPLPAIPPNPTTYPSGDPTHFDVDGLGRIRYVGPPARPIDDRWSLTDDTTTPTMGRR